jgi:hypothetical protein
VPLKLIVVVGFANDVLTIISVPVAAPAATGSKTTGSVAVWPEAKIKGNIPLGTE